MQSVLVLALLIVLFLLDLVIFALVRGFFGLPHFRFDFPEVLKLFPCLKSSISVEMMIFAMGGSCILIQMNQVSFCTLVVMWMQYVPPHKKSHVCARFIVSREQKQKQ
ncbi:Uncharacterized protein Fot_14432 [Forsythia ovata]|uniref:Uncharacterized protein n=1 Tax=Forsythia ovata TaxID=205694 RepID=A0ABD1W6B7_9LAMI